MKRQVRFVDDIDAYHFILNESESISFSLSKDTLSFSANDFYRCFFKGIDEKPDYVLTCPDDELKGQPKHVFDTVEAIFKKACDSTDENWFKKQEDADAQNLPDLNEDDF